MVGLAVKDGVIGLAAVLKEVRWETEVTRRCLDGFLENGKRNSGLAPAQLMAPFPVGELGVAETESMSSSGKKDAPEALI